MVNIRREMPGDISSVRYVNEQAFRQKEESVIIDKLRNRDMVKLSIVASREKPWRGIGAR